MEQQSSYLCQSEFFFFPSSSFINIYSLYKKWYFAFHDDVILSIHNRVTKEYRESLAKNAKVLFQKFKDHSRDIQNRYVREVKKNAKDVSSDLVFSVQQQIPIITEQFVHEAEKILIEKQNELLSVKNE